jgi:CBS domain-containing protein
MAEKKIGCVPVVDNGTLVGLITTTNVLRYLEEIT